MKDHCNPLGMSALRARLVVIVRCPLCGGWIVGNDYSDHVENVHLAALPGSLTDQPPSPRRQGPGSSLEPSERLLRSREVCPKCWVKACSETLPADARRLIEELERRRQRGQDAQMGMIIVE